MNDHLPSAQELSAQLFALYEPVSRGQPSFCVDGRKPQDQNADTLYPQSLGGSYHFGILEWIIDPNNKNYPTPNEGITAGIDNIFASNIPLGIHGDSHAHMPKTGCGFGDKQEEILNYLLSNQQKIWETLILVYPEFNTQSTVWDQVIIKLVNKSNTFINVPNGEELAKTAKLKSAKKQVLDGEHEEMAAVVNMVTGTTLNKSRSNGNRTQAFNLDLWYVQKSLQKMGWAQGQIQEATLLSLGLFAATERVLRSGKDPLPLIIKQS